MEEISLHSGADYSNVVKSLIEKTYDTITYLHTKYGRLNLPHTFSVIKCISNMINGFKYK